jgi:hypothetical protein
MRTLVCRHCGRRVAANKKLKHHLQHYCGRKECQHSRKLEYERARYKNNPLYRSRKLEKARERKKKMAEQGNVQYFSDYQRFYRATHPQYVIRNREKQRERNARKRDKTSNKTKIVNPDTLISQQPDNDTIYAMIAVDYQKIVNPDTLMLQLIDMMSIANGKPLFVRRL